MNLINNTNCNKYICSYNYCGKPYSIEIKATSIEEAENHLRSIKYNGKIDGEIKLKISIPLKEKWLEKIIRFLR